jgi:hypothetical protein
LNRVNYFFGFGNKNTKKTFSSFLSFNNKQKINLIIVIVTELLMFIENFFIKKLKNLTDSVPILM